MVQAVEVEEDESSYEGLDPIVERCRAEGGVTATDLGELRMALGYGRLGKYVLEEIRGALEAKLLGHFPTNTLQPEINTKPRQDQVLWLFTNDNSPIAKVMSVVLAPEEQEESAVRAVLASIRIDDETALTPEQKLERVRAIVNR